MAGNPPPDSQELEQALNGLKPGDHVCCIYATDEEHRALLTPFVTRGLDLGEKVIYIVDVRKAEDVLGYLHETGVEVDRYLKTGQLKVRAAAESWGRETAFDPDGMISSLEQETERALAESFSALRVTGELTWTLRELPGSNRLIEYEAKLDEFVSRNKCLSLCQYDSRRFAPGLLLDALATHPTVIIGKQLFENFYYVQPKHFLGPDPEAARLGTWLRNLKLRKRAEQALQKGEEQFRLIIDNLPAFVAQVDSAGNFRYVNINYEIAWGIPREQIVGKHVEEVWGRDGYTTGREHIEAVLGGKRVAYETIFRVPLAGERWMAVECVPDVDSEGKVKGFFALSRDITECKRAEEEVKKARDELECRIQERTEELAKANAQLRLGEMKYRTVADFTADWEYWEGPDTVFYYHSPSCEQISGRKPWDFLNSPSLLHDIILAEDRPVWDEHYRESHREKRPGQLQFRIRRSDGQIVWIEHFCRPVLDEQGEFLGIRASNRDISERKQAQHDLESSEAFLKTVLASMRDHVAVVNREGKILTVNEAWLQFARDNDLKCFDRVLPGANYLEICKLAADQGGHEATMAWEGIRAVLDGCQPQFRMECECSSPDVKRWFSMSVVPLLRPEGGVLIAHHDITRRRAAEEHARKREQSLAEAQQIAHLGSWQWNVEADELAWSDEVYRIFGLQPRQFEATYEAFLHSVHADDRQAVRKAVDACLADPGQTYSIDHRVVRPDGSERIVHERGRVTFDATGRPLRMIGTVQDITDRKQAEAESRRLRSDLAHISRVTTLGEMAAAIAHEINQPLAAILNNAQAAQRFLAGDEPNLKEVREALSDIVEDDRRAGDVIRRVRAVLRKEEPNREPLDVNAMIDEILLLIRSELVTRDLELAFHSSDNLPAVLGDRVQLQQVALNLVRNALEAMADGPRSIRRVSICTRRDGPNIVVSVCDAGPPISDEALAVLFEPFSTTKPDGLGMGLSISRSIIEAHGGRIWAERNTDRGLTVHFTLPCFPRTDTTA